jgi:hypothetical protein
MSMRAVARRLLFLGADMRVLMSGWSAAERTF